MAEEYSVKLKNLIISTLNITADLIESEHGKITANFSFSFKEPIDPQDPTVLFEAKGDFKDDDGLLSVFCEAKAIYEFDPLPEIWKNAVIENCPRLMRQEILDRVQSALQLMGSPIKLTELPE